MKGRLRHRPRHGARQVYARGGYTYGETEQNIPLGGTTVFENQESKQGWVVGAGLDFAITDQLSVQTEYSFVDLGDDTVFSAFGAEVSGDVKFHAVKAALNFRF